MLFIEILAFMIADGPGSERNEGERGHLWIYLGECGKSFGGQYKVVVLGDLM